MALFKRNPNKIKLTHAERTYQTIIIIIVGLVTLTCLFPLLYVIGMSFTGQAEMIEKNYFVIIPERPTILAYQSILQKSNFWSSFLISVSRVLLGVPAALLLTVPGGYVLANKQMPGRRWFMIYFIITMILGGGTIPTSLLMRDLHLLNTFWVYIVPAFGGAFNMLIVKLFVEGIPRRSSSPRIWMALLKCRRCCTSRCRCWFPHCALSVCSRRSATGTPGSTPCYTYVTKI